MNKVGLWCANEAVSRLSDFKVIDNINLSNNYLTDQGMKNILDVVVSFGKPIKRLKFFSNKLVYPDSICHLIEDRRCGLGVHGGPTEIHLSHNSLEPKFLDRLLKSFSAYKSFIKKPISPPIWLRCEQNGLEKAGAELVEQYEKEGLKVCIVQRAFRKQADPYADVHLYL